jgi:DNA-binding NarL/FixJ family response regulator
VDDPPVVFITYAQRAVIAELCADGASDDTIAERLGVTRNTIRTHLRILRQATGYHDRTALAVALLRGRIRLRTVSRPRDHQPAEETAA